MLLRRVVNVLFFQTVRALFVPDGGHLCTEAHPDPRFAAFCKWLADNCLVKSAPGLDRVFIGEFVHGDIAVRGLGVTEDVRAGEKIMCVSKQCRLSGEQGSRMPNWQRAVFTEMGEALQDDDHFIPTAVLAEQLELSNESFWSPYIGTLPTDEDVKAFHPKYLTDLDSANKLGYWRWWVNDTRKLYDQYRKIVEQMQLRPASWQSFERAYFFSVTRSFGQVGIVPGVDLANNAVEFSSGQRFGFINAFCLSALRDMKAGDEITCDYGAETKSPWMMFQIYGFSHPNVAHDSAGHRGICQTLHKATAQKDLAAGTGVHRNLLAFLDRNCAAADQDVDASFVVPDEAEICSLKHSNPTIAAFCSWFHRECSLGPSVDQVFIGKFLHDGVPVRGLGVTKDIAEGENVLCVAPKCRVSAEDGNELVPEWLRSILNEIDEQDEILHFALLFAQELDRAGESFWAPYFKTLPTVDELQEFHPYFLLDVGIPSHLQLWPQWNTTLYQNYLKYRSLLESQQQAPPTWGNVRLAYFFAVSRSFSEAGIVPLVDLANGAETPNTYQQYQVGRGLCLAAQRDLKAGEEITCEYGAGTKSPYQMFQTYGFSFSNGAHDLASHADDCASLRQISRDALAKGSKADRNFLGFLVRSCGSFDAQEL